MTLYDHIKSLLGIPSRKPPEPERYPTEDESNEIQNNKSGETSLQDQFNNDGNINIFEDVVALNKLLEHQMKFFVQHQEELLKNGSKMLGEHIFKGFEHALPGIQDEGNNTNPRDFLLSPNFKYGKRNSESGEDESRSSSFDNPEDFTNLNRYFEEEISEFIKPFFDIFKNNSFFGSHGLPFQFKSVPGIMPQEDLDDNQLHPRDNLLKPGYKNTTDDSKTDSDVDGKINVLDINKLLTKDTPNISEKFGISKDHTPTRTFSNFSYMSCRTIRKPDGTVEIHEVTRDSEGNEKVTITEIKGNEKRTITKDPHKYDIDNTDIMDMHPLSDYRYLYEKFFKK